MIMKEISYKTLMKVTWDEYWISVLDYVEDGIKGNLGVFDCVDANMNLDQNDFE